MNSTANVHWNNGQPVEKHNERDEELCKHESHIDLYNEHGSSFHEQIYHKDLVKVYQDVFGDAIEEYNKKQKRKDRFLDVDKYMDGVEKDTRGKKQTKLKNGKRIRDENATREGKQLQYEFTVCVGNTDVVEKDSDGKVVYDDNDHKKFKEMFPRELQCSILQKYYDTFTENNPNFILVGVDRHGDEGYYNFKEQWEYSVIHDHYRIVPVATGFKQGLSIQNSMNKAMLAMGFDDSNCYEKWAKKEKERLEKITQEEYKKYCEAHPDYAKEHGDLTIYHPVSEKNKEGGKTKEQYVLEKQLEETVHELVSTKKDYETKKKECETKIEKIDTLRNEIADKYNSIENPLTKDFVNYLDSQTIKKHGESITIKEFFDEWFDKYKRHKRKEVLKEIDAKTKDIVQPISEQAEPVPKPQPVPEPERVELPKKPKRPSQIYDELRLEQMKKQSDEFSL